MRIKHKAALIEVLTNFINSCEDRLGSIQEQLSIATGDREERLLEKEGTVGDVQDLAEQLRDQLEASDDV